MDGLALAIRRCDLQLKLDNKTEGFGNCFPNAIVQQCRRPEVRTWLQDKKPHALFYCQEHVRREVTNFAQRSQHIRITNLKTKYENEIMPVEGKSWTDYWSQMAKDGTWVDHLFVQVTAWYMELDIMILTSSSLPKSPFVFISGHIEINKASTNGPPILLGNYTNIHYQSLVEDHETLQQNVKPKIINNKQNEDEVRGDDFIYKHGSDKIIFKSLNNNKSIPTFNFTLVLFFFYFCRPFLLQKFLPALLFPFILFHFE